MGVFDWFRRKARAREAVPQDVIDALASCVKRINAVDERLDVLEGSHRRMRGYVYARKGRIDDRALDDGGAAMGRREWLDKQSQQRKLTREELRELAGLTPLKTVPRPE